ncbi:MAG: hypothetical protein IPJ65_17010 [Archangiaceae bacterium]|nr:hypothetical protein [Archangiaceae bacterium]
MTRPPADGPSRDGREGKSRQLPRVAAPAGSSERTTRGLQRALLTPIPNVTAVDLNGLAHLPDWRKPVLLSKLDGNLVIAATAGHPAVDLSRRALAHRIVGPAADDLAPGDVSGALRLLTQVERVAAHQLVNELWFEGVLSRTVSPVQRTATKVSFVVHSTVTGTADVPRFDRVYDGEQATYSLRVTQTVVLETGDLVALDRSTGDVFLPDADGRVAVPVSWSTFLANPDVALVTRGDDPQVVDGLKFRTVENVVETGVL